MGVAHAQFVGLSVLFVRSVLAGDRIATRTVLGAVEGNAVDGDGDLTQCGSAFVVAVRFRAVGCVVAAGRVVAG